MKRNKGKRDNIPQHRRQSVPQLTTKGENRGGGTD